jgi:hypothetical protein
MISPLCSYPDGRHALLGRSSSGLFSPRSLITSKANIEQSLFDFDDSCGILLSDQEQAATEGTGCKS